MKNFINKTLAQTLGYHFTKYRLKERQVFEMQRALCRRNRPLIFDVGAYQGESVRAYNTYFEGQCQIFSFEPYQTSFESLQKNVKGMSNVEVFNVALGNEEAHSELHVNKFAATNSFLPSAAEGIQAWGEHSLGTECVVQVPIRTIDRLVEEYQIEQIDILKMDTQGTEHLVLEGAKEAIAQGKIHLLYSELIVMPIYEGQIALDEMLRIFREFGFELYRLFQTMDHKGKLKFMDGIFVYKG